MRNFLGKDETPDNDESEIDKSFWEWAMSHPNQLPSREEMHVMELQLHSEWLQRNFPNWY